MSHDATRAPTPDAKAERLHAAIQKLILMRETGPKRAAWHQARVQTLWRLQRELAAHEASARAASAHHPDA